VYTDINTLKCIKCNDIYYDCHTCDEGLDWYDNDKGSFCYKCKYHFCIYCFCHNGIVDDDNEYLCGKCCGMTPEECENYKKNHARRMLNLDLVMLKSRTSFSL
jgi:hypothetical protein